jgi:hypothetical protein
MKLRKFIFSLSALALLVSPLAALAATKAPAAATPAPQTAPVPTTGINLQISPLPILLNAKPGTSVSTDLRIRNAGTENELLVVKLKRFSEEGPNGEIKLTDPAPSDPFPKWVTFSKTIFAAPPDQWQTIKMTINIPKDAAFGYYYAVEFSRAHPTKAQPGKPAIEGSVAIFILLNAESPGAKKSLQVASFTADHNFYEFLPVTFSVRVHNTGNIHFAPAGNIFIQAGKKQVSTILVNSPGGNVLPNSYRIFTAQWKDGFPVYRDKENNGVPERDKKGNIKRSLHWDFAQVPKLRIGKYTAHLIMIYDDGQRDVPIEGDLSFWVVPWRLILGAIAVPIVPAFLVWWLTKRRYQRKLAQIERGRR